MSKKVWFILIIGLVVVAGISYGFLSTTEIETEKPVTQTQQKQDQEYPDAPDFALQDLNGNIVKLSDYIDSDVDFLKYSQISCFERKSYTQNRL